MAREYEPFTPVVAIWEDCYTEAQSQFESPATALAAYKPCIRKSHGLYVGRAMRNGRDCVVIATDDDRNEDCPTGIGGPIFIPSGMLIRIEELQRPAVKKRRRRTA